VISQFRMQDIESQDAAQYRVAAIVVTFNPEPAILSELLRAVAPQVDAIVIVDNTGGVGADLAGSLPDAYSTAVIRNARNAGLGSAQNQGIQWAAGGRFTHVFMLDQDSVPEADCISRLIEADAKLRRAGVALAAVGPRIVDRRTGRSYSFKKFTLTGIKHSFCSGGTDLVPADFLIASGSLSAMEALQAVGPMDEGLFIDRIDIDWCLRAAAMGRSVYGVCSARLRHEPGERSRRIWLGRWREVALHSPERTYYMVRNSILLYRRAHATLRWIINDVIWLIGNVFISCTFAPARRRRAGLILNALRDGFAQVRGPL
jgi:rhamnosyltransferase